MSLRMAWIVATGRSLITSCRNGPLPRGRLDPSAVEAASERAAERFDTSGAPSARHQGEIMSRAATVPAASPPRTQMPRVSMGHGLAVLRSARRELYRPRQPGDRRSQHPAGPARRRHDDGLPARLVLLDLRADAASGGLARGPLRRPSRVSDRGRLVVVVHRVDVGRELGLDDVRASPAAGRRRGRGLPVLHARGVALDTTARARPRVLGLRLGLARRQPDRDPALRLAGGVVRLAHVLRGHRAARLRLDRGAGCLSTASRSATRTSRPRRCARWRTPARCRRRTRCRCGGCRFSATAPSGA